jgi:hypothetical protein
VRFCGQCDKSVYNLSAMTRAEAEALVASKDGRVCVRLYQRQDGTVLTQDCPVGVRRLRIRARLWRTASGATVSAALMLGVVTGRAWGDLTLRNRQAQAQAQPHRALMGGAVAQPPKMGEMVALPASPKKPELKPRPEPKMGKIARPDPEALQGDMSFID